MKNVAMLIWKPLYAVACKISALCLCVFFPLGPKKSGRYDLMEGINLLNVHALVK